MDTWVWIVIVAVVAVLVVIGASALVASRRRRELQEGFGAEYDRAVADAPSRREAEEELRERQRRHDELELRPLSPVSRERFLRRWEAAQTRFVDDPEGAIGDADALVLEAMRERGYPVDDFEQRAADLSVEHAGAIESYRTAHAISLRSARGEASTEDRRQAIVHYRALFEELVEADEIAWVDR